MFGTGGERGNLSMNPETPGADRRARTLARLL